MSAEPVDDSEPSSPQALPRRFVVQLSHRGRVVRVLIAIVLSVLGLIPVPYIGWGYGLVVSAPAAVLLFLAGKDRQQRRIVLLWSIPTVLGLGLGLWSVAVYALQGASADVIPMILGATIVTSLMAAVLGQPHAS